MTRLNHSRSNEYLQHDPGYDDPTRVPLLLVVGLLNTRAIVCVLFLITDMVPEFCEAPRFAGAKHRANSGSCFPS
jgi:hypothetical protein